MKEKGMVFMKAAICTKYGAPDVVKVMDVPIPTISSNEVLIKVMASAVNSGDVRTRALVASPIMRKIMRLVLGYNKPRKPILGVALSGEIVEIGQNVTNYKVGNQVFAMTGLRFGGHAQYAVLEQSSAMAMKPKRALYEEAAVLPFGGTSALHFLRKAKITRGQRVLIYGASGSVGTSAVQIAKYLGTHVTAVCSEKHISVLKTLGVDEIIDYNSKEYLNLKEQYDLIFDAVGKIKKADVSHLLKPKGNFISVAGYGVASEKKEDLIFLARMYDVGRLKPVIDRTFTLEEIALAHEYVDQGTKTGNVAITIGHE